MGKQPQTVALHPLADQITSHELQVKQGHSVTADVHEALEMRVFGQCSSSPWGNCPDTTVTTVNGTKDTAQFLEDLY